VADLHNSLDVSRQQQLLSLLFQRLAIRGGAIVDFAIKPPFEDLLTHPPDSNGGSSRGASGEFELTSVKRAIKSLFEFDFDALDRLLDGDGRQDAHEASTTSELDRAPLH
jgi:hypothetical protein